MTTLKNFTDIDATITLEASEDMDNAYTAVKQGASNTDTADLCDTAGEKPIGVIGQNHDDGDFISIQRAGVATIRAGAAVASAAIVATDGSGRAITMTDLHEWQLGIALTAASAVGDEISMLIDIQPRDLAASLGTGLRVVKTRIAAAASGFAAETDLFTLPTTAVVMDVFINVLTLETTGTTGSIDVGTSTVSNDPDGFLDGVDATSTGLLRGVMTDGANTRGALLEDNEDGAGAIVPAPDLTSLGAVVSASPAASDYAELVADVYVVFLELG